LQIGRIRFRPVVCAGNGSAVPGGKAVPQAHDWPSGRSRKLILRAGTTGGGKYGKYGKYGAQKGQVFHKNLSIYISIRVFRA
jgi:hypothetical protein